jgi:hypothetical protein
VLKGLRVHKVLKGLRVHKVLKELQGLKVHKVSRVFLAQLALKGLKVIQVL